MKFRSPAWRSLAAAMWLVFAVRAIAWSIEPTSAPAGTGEVLKFRRIYAPADRVQDWPRGTEKYLPIETEEFERLLGIVQTHALGAPGAETPLLVAAEFRAKLSAEELMVGDGELKISHTAQTAALLPLGGCNLAIGEASWEGADNLAASWGNAGDGQLSVLVDKSAELRIAWSLRGERTASGAVNFRFELPPCPSSRLIVDLPQRLTVQVDQGLITPINGAPENFNRWQIDLGARRRLNLRVVAEGASEQRPELRLLRQAVTYEFSPRGIDVVAQLKLDIHDTPLTRLTVHLDPFLRLVAARYGEQQIPWSMTSDPQTQSSKIVLELPEPLLGTGRVIHLSALAPLVTEQKGRLPGIRPDNVFWQEGLATLVIPSTLVLEDLNTIDCRQSKTAPLAAPRSGESLEIQFYSPEAAIEVVVARPEDTPQVSTGTQLELGPAEIVGRAIAEFSVRQGERFTAQARIPAPWLIDSVESVDPENSVDWTLDIDKSGNQLLKIRLSKPMSARRSVRLSVSGRRPSAIGEELSVENMQMLHFDDVVLGKQYMSLRASDSLELRTTGTEELLRFEPASLSKSDALLFAEPPSGLLFAIDAAAARLRVALANRRPSFVADIEVDAVVQGKTLTETYNVRCTPESAPVDRLHVHFSQADPAPLRWTLAGNSSGTVTSRRLTAEEESVNGVGGTGETWELHLRAPRSKAFDLRAVRTRPFTANQSLALASLPEAASQRGTIVIRAIGETGLTIKNRRLKSIPAESVQDGRYPTARATYRYEPARDGLGPEPLVMVSPSEPRQAESGAWAWSCDLESRYASQDTSIHAVRCRIQTAGRQQIRVRMPVGAKLRGITIDQNPLPQVLVDSFRHEFPIDLPSGQSHSVVSLYFVTRGELPELICQLSPPMPEFDIPIMARQWILWLPADYELCGVDPRLQSLNVTRLTWSERLFGPLGRDLRSKWFLPLVFADWQNLAGVPIERQRGEQAIKRLQAGLEAVLIDARKQADLSDLTWGAIWSQVLQSEAAADLSVLFDRDLLERSGVSSASLARLSSFDGSSIAAADLIKQSKIMVLVHENRLLITSNMAASLYRRQLVPLGHEAYAWVRPGPLADEIEAAATTPATDFWTLEAWLDDSERFPWKSIPASASFSENLGWNAYLLQLPESGATGVQVARSAATRSSGWAVFLLLIALGGWRGRKYPLAWLVLVASLGSLCLVIPEAFVPLLSPAFLGSLICLIVLLADQTTPPRSVTVSKAPSSTRLARAGQIAVLLLFVFSWGLPNLPGRADELQKKEAPADAASEAASPTEAGKADEKKSSSVSKQGAAGAGRAAVESVHKVFVPVDSERQPTGDRYYVPESMYEEIYRRAALATRQPHGWLIHHAAYRGVLSRDTTQRKLTVTELTAAFQVQVFQKNTRVRIPFGVDELHLPTVRLDGQQIQVEWEAGSSTFSFQVAEPGVYRLELTAQPVVEAFGATAGFDIAIPSLAASSLHLSVPADAPVIELPTAHGEVVVSKERGEILAQLGPTRRLAARWSQISSMEGSVPNLDVDELLWVKVQPGSTVIDARFKFRVLEGKVRQLRLLADPRLRLLTPAGADTLISSVHTLPGDPETIDLELSNPLSNQAVVNLSFLVTGTSGVGNLKLPFLGITGARSSKRWLAISIDPALREERVEPLREDLKALAITDFAAEWGAADAKPNSAYSISRGEPALVLTTRPNKVATTAEQTMAVSIDRAQAQVILQAAMTTSAGYNFRLRISAPPEMEVDSISLLEEDAERVARWSRDPGGAVTVFLSGPVSGLQSLLLKGRMPVPEQGAFVIAPLQLQDVQIKKHQVQVFRKGAVLVELLDRARFMPVEAGTLEDDEQELGQFLGSYQADDPAAPLALSVTPNLPIPVATQVTTLIRDDDHWIAEVDYQVQVQNGLMDVLRFDIPAHWTEPFQVDRGSAYQVVSIPGESRRQLVVRPSTPIKDQYRIRITGRVALTSGERLRVPDIVPLGMARLKRYLALPQQLELQQVIWETVGLRTSRLPDGFQRDVISPESYTVYQVLGERFQASLKSVERSSGIPQVRLADITVSWQANGRCYGVATFDIEPAGTIGCTLRLPAGYQVLHATVAGLPALLTPEKADRYFVSLGMGQLPQRLEVVFIGSILARGRQSDHWRLEAPSLVDLRPETTLWTVYGPDRPFSSPAEAKAVVQPADQQTLRLKSLVTLVESAADVAAEQPAEEVSRWYRPWQGRITTARLQGNWQSQFDGAGREVREAALREIDKRQASAAKRLGIAEDMSPTKSAAEPDDLLADVQTGRAITRYAFEGQQIGIDVLYPERLKGDLAGRLAWATILTGFAAGAALMLRKEQLASRYSPSLLGIVIGLFWWTWLSPSALGLLVLGVSATLAARAKWPLIRDRLLRRRPQVLA